MKCKRCGEDIADGAAYCSDCGEKAKRKNIYIALVLTFIFSGLDRYMPGKTDKGIKILALRVIFLSLAVFVSIFTIFALIV